MSYVGGDEYHGDQAAAQLIRNPKNTITCFRDFIGKSFADIDPRSCALSAHPIEKDGKTAFTLNVAASPEDGSPKPQTMTVEEVTARHLTKLRDSAADFLGKKISGVVMTVPTDFTAMQKDALRKISNEAGVPVIQIIYEPVSAVLAYSALDLANGVDVTVNKNIVVADIGATRSDIAVISSRGGLYTILSTVHDYNIGGTLLDDTLIDHFGKEFQKKHKIDIKGNTRALARMKAQCEVTKKTLSASSSATVSVESLAEGFDFHSSINRFRYETLARKIIGQIVDLIQSAVKKADLENFDIDEIIMVGGTCHTPKLASAVSLVFPESTKVRSPTTYVPSLNPSELSSQGAAIQASLIAEFEAEDIAENTHPVITSVPHLAHPIGLKQGSKFVTVLDIHTPLPSRKAISIEGPETAGDALIEIFEGKLDVKVTQLEKQAKDEDDSDSEDEDEDDTPREERSRMHTAETKIAQIVVKGVEAKKHIEVMIQVDAESKVTVQARPLGGKGEAARGEIPPK